LGGTLFIDEAYMLTRGASEFGHEALDTLLKRMDTEQDKLLLLLQDIKKE